MDTQLDSGEVPLESFPYPQNDEFYAREIYTQLDGMQDEIRLVRVLPGNPEAPILCELVQNLSLRSLQHERPELTNDIRFENFGREVFRSRGKNPDGTEVYLADLGHEDCLQQGYSENKAISPLGDEYYALSYAAGDLQNIEPITLAGVVFNIYSSIAYAIRRLRSQSTTLQIWIDQRLGTPTSGFAPSAKAFNFSVLNHITTQHRNTIRDTSLLKENMADENPQDPAEYTALMIVPPVVTQPVTQPPAVEPKWPERLTLSPYILKKIHLVLIVLPPILTAFFLTFSHENICRAEAGTLISTAILSGAVAHIFNWGFASLVEEHVQDPLKMEVTKRIVNRWRLFSFTFVRDHVYSTLGLLGKDYGIQPDYSRTTSVKNVFVVAARAIIEHERCLDLFATRPDQQKHKSRFRLPWWVPEFSTERDYSTFLLCHASAEQKYTPDPRLDFAADTAGTPSAILMCSGRILSSLVDSPEALGEVGAASGEASLRTLLANWRYCMSHASINNVYRPTQEVADMALKSAMTMGILGVGATGDQHPTYIAAIQQATQWKTWRFFVSPSGYIGFAPAYVRSDDLLVLLVNCPVVLAVRKMSTGPNHSYRLLGAVYLHGFDIDRDFQDKLRDPAEMSALQTIRLI
ncbi:hypothetical protein EDD37DRAFT_696498 [Exophiala viscosa]|uniref:uncharacterized protein n=1 Tax=Exophiala viscosa TaxID=2486360 RepID=UPI002199DF85|nr:hypothetical protein EDD37DRAFT_696498 [Exophiala viscosa]